MNTKTVSVYGQKYKMNTKTASVYGRKHKMNNYGKIYCT